MKKVQPIDNTDRAIAVRIVAIQHAAYAVEAKLMAFDGIPPLHETVADVQAITGLKWRGAFEDEVLVGLIAWIDHEHSIEIDRLAIDPVWSRQGFGRRLVQAVPLADTTEVSTGSANHPARALYESESFRSIGATQVAAGVFTTQLRRSRSGIQVTPTESDAVLVAAEVMGEEVQSCTRFTTGLRHWVYDVVLESGRSIVVRMSHPEHGPELEGGLFWSELLRQQGVRVPDVVSHDTFAPQPYMVLERLPGSDLGNVFDELSKSQLRGIAETVADMQRRTGQLRQGSGFGYALNYESPLESSWYQVLEQSVERSAQAIRTAGAVNPHWIDKVTSELEQAASQLDDVEPVAFLHDATTKNVIVASGEVSGLVDVDHMAFGDPLWATALTRMSLLSAQRPTNYIDFLDPGEGHRARLDLYTAFFCLGFLAELGQRFNQHAAAPIDVSHQQHLEALLDSLLTD